MMHTQQMLLLFLCLPISIYLFSRWILKENMYEILNFSPSVSTIVTVQVYNTVHGTRFSKRMRHFKPN
jgi:hypothetical protein